MTVDGLPRAGRTIRLPVGGWGTRTALCAAGLSDVVGWGSGEVELLQLAETTQELWRQHELRIRLALYHMPHADKFLVRR